jgi:prevent-host-death family protein
VKTIEMAEATGALSGYARQARRGPVVVMRRGKPVAALVPLDAEQWEDFVVSTHPGFLDLIERSRASFRAHGGIPLEDIEREFGVKRAGRSTGRRRRRKT